MVGICYLKMKKTGKWMKQIQVKIPPKQLLKKEAAKSLAVFCPNGCGNINLSSESSLTEISKCPNCGAQTMLVSKEANEFHPRKNFEPDQQRFPLKTSGGSRAFEYGRVVKLDEKRAAKWNVFEFVGFVGTILFYFFGFLICFEILKHICNFFDDEQTNTMQAKILAFFVVFISAIALPFFPIPMRLKANPIAAKIKKGINAFYALVGVVLAVGTVVVSVIGILFWLYGMVSDVGLHSKQADNTPSYVSDANKGYMTRQDDELLTATELKKDMGQSLTTSEQDYLNSAQVTGLNFLDHVGC